MRNYKHLSFTDRLKIEAWESIGTSPRVMAKELGVHISTIYRELKRGRYERLNTDLTTEDRYSPDIAEKKYRDNLKAKGTGLKLGNDHEYAAYLEYKVSVEKYAPGAILGEIKKNGMVFQTTISKTTFYRYIDDGVFLTITNKDLPIKRNKNKQKHNHVQASRAPKGKSIEKRPKEIESRKTFGNWEMDSVEGKKRTKKALLVLTTLDALEAEMGAKRFALIFQTITVDNGSEFSDYEGIERSATGEGKRTNVYFCHPYSSYERGSNENQNKMIRRHYPKGYDFSNVTPADIQKLENWINNYPRKIFDFYSSSDLYEACLNDLFTA